MATKVERAIWAIRTLNEEFPDGISIELTNTGIVSAFGTLTIDGEEFSIRIGG